MIGSRPIPVEMAVVRRNDNAIPRELLQRSTGSSSVVAWSELLLVDAESGTVYVNSVSGPKRYAIKESRWEAYGATMERAAENTQLFQVIHIDGDTLSYEAYTTTGQLYDAFDLVKQPDGPNRLVPRQPPDTPERTHENTLP